MDRHERFSIAVRALHSAEHELMPAAIGAARTTHHHTIADTMEQLAGTIRALVILVQEEDLQVGGVSTGPNRLLDY